MQVIIAQQNDTIDLVCWRYFGETAGLTEQVLEMNPHIDRKSPVLPIGTSIRLPKAEAPKKRTINLWD